MKIGDKVTIIADHFYAFGKQGIVTEYMEDSNIPYTVHWEVDGLSNHNYFAEDELELVQ